jgi:hypothetical protein
MQRRAREEKLEVLHPEYGTKPRVYYKNLDRWNKVFVAGSVAGKIRGVLECVEGAKVTLEKDGRRVAEAVTDPYGDFRLAGLEEESGAYRLGISDARFAPKSLEVKLGGAVVLNDIVLET